MHYFVFLAAFISLSAAVSYVRQMFRGQAKPNKVSWLLWSVAPTIAAIAAFSEGVTLAVLPVFMAGFSTLIVFVFSFVCKGAYWDIRRFDLICGAVSLLALIFWYLTKQADIAIIFSILSDFLACLPTFAKAWKYPETEHVSPYASGIFSAFTSFLAISHWNFASVAFPAYLFLINIALSVAIEHRRFIPRRKEVK
ncbi:hypothetical protein ACFO26_06555 [Lactococcus nasutitermitis]|uniref:Uncharacterized protein n=1 Tax=Lactococcus nasutitermitis TaxID=1652957 RepID=A0ABV9JDR0_9LACT|nr:hypothetical protein [Lactococcus nasutitermitis]